MLFIDSLFDLLLYKEIYLRLLFFTYSLNLSNSFIFLFNYAFNNENSLISLTENLKNDRSKLN